MDKLIEQFVAYPSDATRLRLQNYLNKYPMAVCLASPQTQEFLKVNGFN
jgi:hypothetical protein